MQTYDKRDILREIEDFGTKEDRMSVRKIKSRDAQDRLLSTQIIIAVLVVAVVLLLSKMSPAGFEKLAAQYTAFVAKPPVWELENVQNIFEPLLQTIRTWIGNA